MDTQENRQQTYVLDPESAAEMGRLLLQDRLLNEAMGGLLPECSEQEIATIWKTLDVGCGPGGWATGLAQKYPHMDVTGIDVSNRMITYAQVQVEREGISSNLHFAVMSALEPLKFADNSFELVNIRAAIAFVPRAFWPTMLSECVRVLRPGGTLRLTEGEHLGITNSPAFAKFNNLGTTMLYKNGYGFSPDGSTFGMTPMLGKLLMDAGCQDMQHRSHTVDFSYGTPLHQPQVQNYATIYQLGIDNAIKQGMLSEEDAKRLYHLFLEELQAETFRGVTFFLTAWGQKSQA